MSDELKVGTIPAGSPVTINLTQPAAPAPATEKRAEPEQLAEAKKAKREAKLAAARDAGADEMLDKLGVKKSERARMVEEIKAGRLKLAQAKEEVVAAKTELDTLKPYKDQLEQITATLKKYADQEFSTLPEPFQKALAAMKLEDPKARLDMIEVWKSTGVITATQAKDATKDVKETAAATAPKPSNTMAAASGAASPAGPVMNHYEHWKQLQTQGQPFLAAQYWNAHQIKILEQRPK